jgi:hypothetical protein
LFLFTDFRIGNVNGIPGLEANQLSRDKKPCSQPWNHPKDSSERGGTPMIGTHEMGRNLFSREPKASADALANREPL